MVAAQERMGLTAEEESTIHSSIDRAMEYITRLRGSHDRLRDRNTELLTENRVLRMQVERLMHALGQGAGDLERIADDLVADLRVRAAAMRAAAERETGALL